MSRRATTPATTPETSVSRLERVLRVGMTLQTPVADISTNPGDDPTGFRGYGPLPLPPPPPNMTVPKSVKNVIPPSTDPKRIPLLKWNEWLRDNLTWASAFRMQTPLKTFQVEYIKLTADQLTSVKQTLGKFQEIVMNKFGIIRKDSPDTLPVTERFGWSDPSTMDPLDPLDHILARVIDIECFLDTIMSIRTRDGLYICPRSTWDAFQQLIIGFVPHMYDRGEPPSGDTEQKMLEEFNKMTSILESIGKGGNIRPLESKGADGAEPSPKKFRPGPAQSNPDGIPDGPPGYRSDGLKMYVAKLQRERAEREKEERERAGQPSLPYEDDSDEGPPYRSLGE